MDSKSKKKIKLISNLSSKIPHKCPVCEGRGILPLGFYNNYPHQSLTYNIPETCKSCGGAGIIWG